MSSRSLVTVLHASVSALLLCLLGCGGKGEAGPNSALGAAGAGEMNAAGSPSTSGAGNTAGATGAAGSTAGSAGGSSSNEGPPDVLGIAGMAGMAAGMNGGPLSPAAFTWAGIIGTGQSLAVGTLPVNQVVNQQPYANLMLSLGAAGVPPFDGSVAGLAMAPLVEPLRAESSGFPRPYPGNLWGETPHGAMAAQVSALAAQAPGSEYVTVHSVVGESGQGMVAIRKGAIEMAMDGGIVGRAYAASMFEVEAITRLAREAGETYGVGAIVLTHGETDAGNANYEAELVELWTNYNADVAAITGQTSSIPMIVSQHHAYGFTAGVRSGPSASTIAQWQVGLSHPGDIICSGPKYHLPYIADGIHLEVRGYEMLGEKYGQIYHQRVILGAEWQPLQPTVVEREGPVVRVQFHVPVGPLVWDEALPAPHQGTEWALGRGFELSSGGAPLEIVSAEIVGDSVELTAAANVPAGATIGYALTSDGVVLAGRGHRVGQLRDSDPFVGQVTGAAQPNYAVAFQLNVP